MAICTNCKKKWGLLSTYKITMTNNGVNCPHCGQKQYLSTRSQQNLSIGWLTVLAVLFIPFLVKLSNDKEPMW